MTEPVTHDARSTGAYRRIATEEAWGPPELFDVYRRMYDRNEGGRGFQVYQGYYLFSEADRVRFVKERVQDLGAQRLADMDAVGIDHAVLSLTAPGTQVMDADTARAIAALSNDRLAEACRQHPSRFSGLAAVGFDDVPAAVSELERAVTKLGLKGLICNSNINGHYLDEARFSPLFEALEALDVPLYLHPTIPTDAMNGPLIDAGLDGAIFGFAVEAGMHLLRIITSGVLDRFPKLRIVVGHLGEGLPFWFYRLNFMHAGQVAAKRYAAMQPLELTISDYFRRNVWLTTSGMPSAPAIMYTREVVGADRVMYAMDYPYEYVADEVRMQDELPLSAQEKKQFFEGNAIRVFGLDESKLASRARSAS